MDQRNGKPGLVRFSTLRQPISKYWTARLASRTSLSAASLAIPTRPDGGESPHSTFLFSPFIRHCQVGIFRRERRLARNSTFSIRSNEVFRRWESPEVKT